MSDYAISFKPAFHNSVLALPKADQTQVFSKLRVLLTDPLPDGSSKKKLLGYQNVFRLRVGNFRVLYTFGEGYVTPLTVDDRKDVYRDGELVVGELLVPAQGVPGAGDLLETGPRPAPERVHTDTRRAAPAPLPRFLDPEFLTQLRIDEEYHAILETCRTVDDLCTAPIPENVRNRIFDAVMDPDLDRILGEPELLAQDVDELERFAEGELVLFLLRLDPDQEAVVQRAILAAGPVLVKGGPGSGKSTVALYRTRAVLESLRGAGSDKPRILFTTYTNALVTFSRQLLERLLGPDAQYVEVRTYDSLITGILRATGVRLRYASSPDERAALGRAFGRLGPHHAELSRQARTLGRPMLDYLLEEIGQVIEGREIATLEEYLAAPRAGRRVPLSASQREAVWELREHFVRDLDEQGLTTWHRARHRALDAIRVGLWQEQYDAVVVDEAQDLDVVVLRLLTELCSRSNRLFLAADANQSIYGSGFRWADVHEDLRFRGRTSLLRKNYRSTQEIGEAARSYLEDGVLDADEERTYARHGDKPRALHCADDAAEARAIADFLRAAARQHHLGIPSCGVLVPSEGAGTNLAAALTHLGLPAQFMPSRDLDLDAPVVKVLTLKAAKGLEFPVVAIAGLRHGGAPDESVTETVLRERRTMYVAMTRAMRALLVVLPSGAESALFHGLDPALWDLVTKPGSCA